MAASTVFVRALCAGISTLALAPPLAHAQDDRAIQTPAEPSSDTTQAGAVARGDAAAIETADVVVTGSRVITNGNDMPTPVTVATLAQLQTYRPSVFDALLDLPAFAGSTGAGQSQPTNLGGSSTNIAGLSLRGLGVLRTLVLYDGHRLPPTQQNGATDANIVPQMLLQRVDVVTGGASAVYGSDAIGGVVNFVADRKFQGVRIEGRSGVSEEGDDGQYRLGIAGGTDLFGGRGHLEASLEGNYGSGILNRLSRQNFVPRYTIQGNGCPPGVTPCAPYFLAANATVSNLSFGGKIVGPANNPLANYQFSSNGVLTPFVNGDTTGLVGNVAIGGDGAYHTRSSLKAQSDFVQAFGRFDFDLTDDVHYFATATAIRDHAFNNFFNNNINNNFTFSAQNAFLAPQYQAQLANAGIQTFTLAKLWNYGVPPSNTDFYTRQINLMNGLEGRIGKFRWDLTYSHSVGHLDARANAIVNLERLAAGLDAVRDGSGQIVCRVALTNPGAYPGCVPINVFGPTSESQAAIDYFVQKAWVRSRTSMDDFSASIAGSPFDNWAGPVQVAISGEHRRLGFEQQSDTLPVVYDPVDCTKGLRYNCAPFNPATNTGGTSRYQFSVANRPPVHMAVNEIAGETDIPLLQNVPLVRSADLNLAYRHTVYKVTGNPIIDQPAITNTFVADTWKVGLNWQVADMLTIRATRSRDIRAPNLNDLFQPGALTNQNNITDFLTNVTPASTRQQTGGNPNLTPEKALSTTVGIVFRPSPQFSLAVDGYFIRIDDVITSVNGSNVSVQQACYASGGSSPYCALIERPQPISNTTAANAFTKYYVTPINAARLRTKGFDVEANYRLQAFDNPLSLRLLATYQPEIVTTQTGLPDIDIAGTSDAGAAVWRVTGFARYAVGPFSIDWMTRWRSELHLISDQRLKEATPIRAKAVSFSNLTLTYRIENAARGTADLYFNVQNVFDQPPPVISSVIAQQLPGNLGGYAVGDDVVGRAYAVGFRYRF